MKQTKINHFALPTQHTDKTTGLRHFFSLACLRLLHGFVCMQACLLCCVCMNVSAH